ncbi:MAG TPA: Npt1/Npt2 family nucleotide transporter [Polyangiaceae bacterium]
MLARVLGIRQTERRDAAVGFAMLFALMGGHAILETARDTLFLATLPASFLPWAYLAMALLTLLAAALNRGALRRFSRRRALSLSLLLGVGVNLAFFVLSSLAGSASSLLLFYVWTGLFATLVVVQFWLLLGDVLDLAQAKRVFAWIGAGGLVGATVGSAASGLILMWFPAQSLLVAASIAFGVAALMPPLFSRARKVPASTASPAAQANAESAALLSTDAYLLRLLGFVLLGTLMVTGVDYVFKAVVSEAVPKAELGDFFARYYAVLNGCALLVQILLAPQLLRVAGVNRTLLVTPVLLLVTSLGFGLWAGLASALVLRGVDGSLRHSLNRTATEILYLPLSPAIRDRYKALIEALGQRGGQALASLAILGALSAGIAPQQMAWALVVLCAGWLFCIVGLKPHYLELFRTQLRQGTIETRVDVAELDLHALEALVSALSSEDDIEVIAALEMFATYNKLHLVPALILFHPSPAVVLRAFELFSDSSRRDVLRLSGRLLRHPDHAVRGAALRHFSAHEKAMGPLQRCLADQSPAVRATAVVGLISAGAMEGEEPERALSSIIDGDSPEARHALALSLRQLPAERYAWVALALARLKQPGLAAAVARALAVAPAPEHLPALVLLLAQREGRGEAREALRKLGDEGLACLERALADTELPRVVRRHIPRAISYFGTAQAAAVLTEYLPRERDDAVTYKILRGLGRLCADNPETPIEREALLDCARATLEKSITLLSWHLIVDRGRATNARYDSGASELLSALLRDYERSALERVFRLLHIMRPSEEFGMIYDGLRSADPAVRAGSLELIEHVVPDAIRDGIVATVDDAPAAERLANASRFYDAPMRARVVAIDALLAGDAEDIQRAQALLEAAYAEALAEMLGDRSEVLKSVASYHASELGLQGLNPKLFSTAPTEQRSSLSELNDRELDVLAERARLELGRV